MNPLIGIQLHLPEIEPADGFSSHTSLLTSSHKFSTHFVLGFLDPAVRKGPGLQSFSGVESTGGEWTMEIAVELPDLLPNLGGKSEAVIEVEVGPEFKELCLSNRMSQFHYQNKGMAYHVLCPRDRPWHGAASIECSDGTCFLGAEEQLRTLASMRFRITGKNVDDAVEASVDAGVNTLLSGVNSVLRAFRICCKGMSTTTRTIRRDKIAAVYLLVSAEDKSQSVRLAINGAKASRNTGVIDGEDLIKFRAVASGQDRISDIDQIIAEAKSSCSEGEYEFAFLQAVIAAEIATLRSVRAECLRRGVSQNKLDRSRKEMTYSWALNIGIPLCFPEPHCPSQDLLAAMNLARSTRNSLMHEGVFDMKRADIVQLLRDTGDFILALRNAVTAVASRC